MQGRPPRQTGTASAVHRRRRPGAACLHGRETVQPRLLRSIIPSTSIHPRRELVRTSSGPSCAVPTMGDFAELAPRRGRPPTPAAGAQNALRALGARQDPSPARAGPLDQHPPSQRAHPHIERPLLRTAPQRMTNVDQVASGVPVAYGTQPFRMLPRPSIRPLSNPVRASTGSSCALPTAASRAQCSCRPRSRPPRTPVAQRAAPSAQLGATPASSPPRRPASRF